MALSLLGEPLFLGTGDFGRLMKDTFAGYHPIINFAFFTAVIGITMFLMHPTMLLISFVAAMVYSIYLNGMKAVRLNLIFLLPLLLIMAIANPLFNHSGITVLAYLPNGNPITLESILRGLFMAVMFVSVIMWFSCFNAVITSDKIIYLFGRIIPAISLIFAMIMRFVPKFTTQIKVVSEGQRCLGRDAGNGNVWERARNGMRILSIMATWALENGVDTADSMRARGYGLRGRTSFSVFRFDSRDSLLLLIMGAAFLIVIIAIAGSAISIAYFPTFVLNETTWQAWVAYVSFALLCFLPLILDVLEDYKWHVLKSKI